MGSEFCQIQMYPAQEIAANEQFAQKETGHYYALQSSYFLWPLHQSRSSSNLQAIFLMSI